MTRADGFIMDGRLPDIEYRTDAPEEVMARHFHVKTGCQFYLPQLPEPPDGWARLRRKGAEIGQDILVNLISS